MRKKGLPPSWYGIGLIAAFMAVLVAGPRLFQKTHYTMEGAAPDRPALTSFPTEVALPLLRAETGKARPDKALDLKSLAKEHPGGLIVNFWATWCPPCVEELPSLEQLNRQLEARRDPRLPKLVTISVDETPGDVTSFFKTLDYTVSFLVLYDKEATFSRSVGTTKFPETYWIDASGKILHKWIGPQNWLAGDVLGRLSRKP